MRPTWTRPVYLRPAVCQRLAMFPRLDWTINIWTTSFWPLRSLKTQEKFHGQYIFLHDMNTLLGIHLSTKMSSFLLRLNSYLYLVGFLVLAFKDWQKTKTTSPQAPNLSGRHESSPAVESTVFNPTINRMNIKLYFQIL